MMLRLYERIENLHSAGADVKVRRGRQKGSWGHQARVTDAGIRRQVFLSYLEVYNEKVYDLLSSETKNVRGDDKDMKQGRVTLEVRAADLLGRCQGAGSSAPLRAKPAGDCGV